jgi:hypothetical protein
VRLHASQLSASIGQVGSARVNAVRIANCFKNYCPFTLTR